MIVGMIAVDVEAVAIKVADVHAVAVRILIFLPSIRLPTQGFPSAGCPDGPNGRGGTSCKEDPLKDGKTKCQVFPNQPYRSRNRVLARPVNQATRADFRNGNR